MQARTLLAEEARRAITAKRLYGIGEENRNDRRPMPGPGMQGLGHKELLINGRIGVGRWNEHKPEGQALIGAGAQMIRYG